ncbi:unnamed protein product [Meganyctiphanes norvegica]|uniref:Secreted protein n=1 Tax=Meganyctiphanes norvegica TaxID=48144 RepID=A0AAV2R7U1_MEGNR
MIIYMIFSMAQVWGGEVGVYQAIIHVQLARLQVVDYIKSGLPTGTTHTVIALRIKSKVSLLIIRKQIYPTQSYTHVHTTIQAHIHTHAHAYKTYRQTHTHIHKTCTNMHTYTQHLIHTHTHSPNHH